MARTLSEIYSEAKLEKDKRLELNGFDNDSKMSVMNAIVWVVSTCIWTFENLLDVFKVDLAKDLSNRVNGTPAYFSSMLLKYQKGDNLVVSDDGLKFGYANINENNRIISKVAYSEEEAVGFNDKTMVFKVATGSAGAYKSIDYEELLNVRDYLSKILFAGQRAIVVSRKGDILIPRVNVYHDGAVGDGVLYGAIEESLNAFIANIGFNGVVYAQHVIDALQRVEHVKDVSLVSGAGDGDKGIYVAQYDDDGNLIEVDGQVERLVERYIVPNSGYMKQSTRSGLENSIPTWRESITLFKENV